MAEQEQDCGSETSRASSESSSSAPASTLEEGKNVVSRGELKRIMVDYHNTLETGNSITNCNEQALLKLLQEGYQVCICSYAFRNRAQEVRDTLSNYPWMEQVWKLIFTEHRVKHPQAKSSICKAWAIGTLFDDSWDILEDALEKGVSCYPIQTKWEKHQWFTRYGTGEGPWPTFADAVDAFLAKEKRNQQ